MIHEAQKTGSSVVSTSSLHHTTLVTRERPVSDMSMRHSLESFVTIGLIFRISDGFIITISDCDPEYR